MREEYLDRLVKLINEKNYDAAFIAPSEDMDFLLGHSPNLCERFQGLFVTNEGEYFYICNLLTVDEIREVLGKKTKVYGWFDGDIFTDTVERAFRDYNLIGKTIAVNSTSRAFNILEITNKINVKFVNGKSLMEEIRIIKSDEELNGLRRAAEITDQVFTELRTFIKPGMKEADIQNKINESFIEKGAEPGFAIVASGYNSALPHYTGNDRIIQEKDIIIIDFGCKYNNFCSDMTRTVFVGGISEEEKKVYDLVLKANIAGESKVKEGVIASNVDKAARQIINQAGYGKYFTTRLGHGIGYSVHEAPDIKGSNHRELEQGMAFSIEPGIYMKDKFGIRIEDIVVISKNGREVINKSPKELIIL